MHTLLSCGKGSERNVGLIKVCEVNKESFSQFRAMRKIFLGKFGDPRHFLLEFIQPVLEIIQRGIDQGEFRQVDPHDTVVAVGAVIEGTYLVWAYDSDMVDIKKHIRSGVELLINGLVV